MYGSIINSRNWLRSISGCSLSQLHVEGNIHALNGLTNIALVQHVSARDGDQGFEITRPMLPSRTSILHRNIVNRALMGDGILPDIVEGSVVRNWSAGSPFRFSSGLRGSLRDTK
jgi:hypothetical protein